MGALGVRAVRYQVSYHTYLGFHSENFAICLLHNAQMRKDTRLSPLFLYCKQRKLVRGLGTRLVTSSVVS